MEKSVNILLLKNILRDHPLSGKIIETVGDINEGTLIKFINSLYINTVYNQFNSNLLRLNEINIPQDQDDFQTKIARLALRNMIEYIRAMGMNLDQDYFSYNGLYSTFLDDTCEQCNYDIKNFLRVECIEYSCEMGKSIKIKKVRASMRQ